jgi:2-oxoglutarate dehydrogenase E2 component (dihydrolipoamide succinyltransferase)
MEVIMPKMGESVSEGTIIKWHKKAGDKVKRDEIIFEISTDKVDTEIPSPSDGVLEEIKVNEGDTVEVGTVVAIINDNGETSEKTEDRKKEEIVKDEKQTEKFEDKKPEQVKDSVKEKEEKEDTSEKEKSPGEIIEIAMPKMGESVMEGTIIKWHKKVGDKVKKDETIYEISTDKVDTEVPSPEDGTLAEILVAEQETVEVGTIVARLSKGDGVPAKKETKEKIPETKEEKKEEVKEEKKAMHESFSESTARDEGKTSGGFFSPLVMNIARKENVRYDELNKIKGTGLEGRVTKKDILNYIESGKTQPSKPEVKKPEEKKTPAPSYKPTYSDDEIEKIPMDNIRQKIMDHMVRSRDTSVHVSAMLEADMTRIHNFIQKNRDEYFNRDGIKLTYMAFIAHACVKALKEYPLVNATIDGNTIVRKKFINLGIAVALEPTGLIVPNIKAADQKNLKGLAHSINDLASRSRNKKLTPDDITGGTFTITNYGVFGTIFGTPIINQPEVAILGVGAVTKKPVIVEADGTDTIAVRHIMALTLSHDHRLVDGMLGGRFLKYLKDYMENFDDSTI